MISAGAALLDGFALDPDGPAAAFATAQTALYARDPQLQSYFHALQHHVAFDTSPTRVGPARTGTGAPVRSAGRVLGAVGPRPVRADVLLCGAWIWERPQESRLLVRLLGALLRADLHVLVVVHRGSPVRRLLEEVAAASRGRATMFDPRDLWRRVDPRLARGQTEQRARDDLGRVVETLAPRGIAVDAGAALDGFRWNAARLLDWRGAADRVHVDASVVRCHWLPLCSAVAADRLARGVPVTTLQQGVISHTIDAPLVASGYLAFGEPSAALVSDLDRRLRARAGRGGSGAATHPVGSVVDDVVPVAATADARTVLVLDQGSPAATRYYDLAAHHDALVRVAAGAAARGRGRVIVRLHPNPTAAARARWEALARQHPGVVQIRSADRPLREDLVESSVAVGLFSGALAVAAASGVPPLLLAGDLTPDLAPFADQTVDEAAAARTVQRLLADPSAWTEARDRALAAGRRYFAGGASMAVDGELVETVMAP